MKRILATGSIALAGVYQIGKINGALSKGGEPQVAKEKRFGHFRDLSLGHSESTALGERRTRWLRPSLEGTDTPRTLSDVFEGDFSGIDSSIRKVMQDNQVQVLRHQTPCSNMKKIFEAGVLRSAKKTDNSRYHYRGGPKSDVFLELTNDKNEEVAQRPWGDCTLFLSLKVLNQKEAYHVSQFWRYGRKSHSFTADGTDLPQMEKIVGRLPKPDGTLISNEVVVQDSDQLSLKEHLRGLEGPPNEVKEAVLVFRSPGRASAAA